MDTSRHRIQLSAITRLQDHNSAKDLFQGHAPEVPLADFKNKIVVIGPSAVGIGDFHASPMTSTAPGVANTKATLATIWLQGHFVRPAPAIWNALAILVLSLGTSLAVWRFADWRALQWGRAGIGGGIHCRQPLAVPLVEDRAGTGGAFGRAGDGLRRRQSDSLHHEGREKRPLPIHTDEVRFTAAGRAMMKDPRLGELSTEKARADCALLRTSAVSPPSLEKLPGG